MVVPTGLNLEECHGVKLPWCLLVDFMISHDGKKDLIYSFLQRNRAYHDSLETQNVLNISVYLCSV